MKLRRAIAISLAAHAAFLIVAHLRIDPTAGHLDVPAPTDGLAARFANVETSIESPTRSKRAEDDASEVLEMNLTAGLDGSREPETSPDEAESPKPEKTVRKRESPPEDPERNAEEDVEPKASKSDAAPREKQKPVEHTESEPSKQAAPVVAKKSESKAQTDTKPSSGSSGLVDSGSAGSRGGAPAATEGGTPSADGSGGSEGEVRPGVDRGELLRGYARELYRRLARHKHYPNAARRAELEGEVLVEIRIDAKGRILSVELAESSGHDILDRAALETVRSLERFPEPPGALAWNDEKRLQVPIRYALGKRG